MKKIKIAGGLALCFASTAFYYTHATDFALLLEESQAEAKRKAAAAYGCYTPINRENTDIYDFRIQWKPAADCYIKDEGQDGNKSFAVKNNSDSLAYIRIGYELGICTATGFYLKPGQEGRIFKAPGCIPVFLSGFMYEKEDAQGGWINIATRLNERYGTLGHHRWEITGKFSEPAGTRINYLGK